MWSLVIAIIVGLFTVIILGGIAFFVQRFVSIQKIQAAEEKVKKTIDDSNKQVQSILLKAENEARQIIQKSQSSIENEIRERREGIEQIEGRLMQKEKHLDSRETHLAEKEDFLAQEMERLKGLKKKQESLIQELLNILEKAAGLSCEEAKTVLLKTVEREVRLKAGQMIKDVEEQARKIASKKSKEIIATAIQHTTIEHIAPITTSVVNLSDDEMKGRIIGREGRNIRAFEAETGVDVIIDDSPGTVVLSSFDPIRRETARIALIKLIEDGRIHPTRIEELVNKARQELDEIIKEHGERAADEMGIQLPAPLRDLLGKLYYRTSYGQNVLSHSLEVAYLANAMAHELGVNDVLAKRAGLLHDIGKAIDFEQEGSHAKLGEEVCRKYGESPEVLNCILSHHEDVPCETIEAILVMVADGISAARPGARRESLETYLKRLRKLEDIAYSFEGVEKAYAIQAGREIRVLVKPDEVDDPSAHKLALDMAKRIESEVDYPGEVRISIIRETRAIGVAK